MADKWPLKTAAGGGSLGVETADALGDFFVDTSKWHVVTKASSTETAQDALFAVTGKVMVMSLTGRVTNAMAAGSIDITIRTDSPQLDLCAITVVDGDIIGTMYRVNGSPADQLLVSTPAPFVLDGDIIEMVTVGSADSGDAIEWTLCYVPLEAGASVAASA